MGIMPLNFLITVVGFSIYKSYYISEQKTKYIDVNRIFAKEYIKRINENKTLQKFNERKKLYNKCKINKCFQKVLNRNCIYIFHVILIIALDNQNKMVFKALETN